MFISKEAEVICNSLKNNFESWERYQPDIGLSSYFVADDPVLPQMMIMYSTTNIYLVKPFLGHKLVDVSDLFKEQIERVYFSWWDRLWIDRNLTVQRMKKNARIEKEKKDKEKKIRLEIRDRFNKLILELSMIPATKE